MTTAVADPPAARHAREVRDAKRAEALARFEAGEPGAFDELAALYRPLLLRLARPGVRSEEDVDDLIQVGLEALHDAAREYAARGREFVPHAFYTIRRRISNAKRSARRSDRRNGVAAGGDAFDPMALVEARPGPDPADLDEAAFVRRAVSGLPGPERQLLTMQYGLDGRGTRTLAAIAERLGISQSAADRLAAKAKGALKAALGEGFLTRGDEAPTGAGKETPVGHSRHAAGASPNGNGRLKRKVDRRAPVVAPKPIPDAVRGQLVDLLRRLTATEAAVITYRLGLDGGGLRTQVQVAPLVGKGKSQVGKYESRAVARLRQAGLDICPYLSGKPWRDPKADDLLPLPGERPGWNAPRPQGEKPAVDPAASPAPPSDAEAEARWSVIRTLAGLDRAAAARVLGDVAAVVGVARA